MTSTPEKYSALKKRYAKLMTSYKKVKTLVSQKNKNIIGGEPGDAINQENLFSIIDYIFIKYSVYNYFRYYLKFSREIYGHFESDFNNWKTHNNESLKFCIDFLKNNRETYKTSFLLKHCSKKLNPRTFPAKLGDNEWDTALDNNTKLLIEYMNIVYELLDSICKDFDKYYDIMIKYFDD
jgi:hypothetical protein